VIVFLIPRPDFLPVPRVEIRMEAEAFSWDGGSAGGEGSDELDGGNAGLSSPGFDAGTAAAEFIDVPAGVDSLTLWRVSEGRRMKVRGAVGRVFAGSFSTQDVEAPFDTDASYEVEFFDSGMSVASQSVGKVILPWEGDPLGCLLQQPLDPSLNAVVVNLAGSADSVTREAPFELVHTEGNSAPSLIGAGPRRLASNVAVDFAAPSRATSRAVWATLGTDQDPQLPIWLVRPHAGLMPRVFFAGVKALTESEVDLRFGGEWTRFSASVDEVAPPAPALVIAPLSYSDLDTYDSYSARDAAYGSYSAQDSDYSLAGAAG
jgi:hypothetical protein